MDLGHREASGERAVWMLEGYLSAASADDVAAFLDAVREEAERLAAGGVSVRLLQHTFVPEDEMCLLVFEGPSAETVGELSARAGLPPDRITRVLHDSGLGGDAWTTDRRSQGGPSR